MRFPSDGQSISRGSFSNELDKGEIADMVGVLENESLLRRRRKRFGTSMPSKRMALPTGKNFASCYMELCKQQRLRPLPVICVTLPYSLDFTTDRVKMDDWGPILNSLSLDRSLRSISVRSRYQSRKPLEEVNSECKARAMGKAPVLLTRYLLEWLCHSMAQCVRNSTNLTHLELDGIPFPLDCLAVLCMGLAGTESLQHLSLQRCYVGDEGCELVCRTIANVHTIRSLNLSHCELTSRCGTALAGALSRQKLLLYHDTWKDSLRYREPNLEAMPGLRRLTLSENPQLGDTAVLELIEAIRDSLWLKAIDLQHCGLTDRIGNELLALLEQNTALVIVDVRRNPSMNEELVRCITERLEENKECKDGEYEWLSLSRKDQRGAASRTSTTSISSGVRGKQDHAEGKKTTVRPRSAVAAQTKRPYQITKQQKSAPPAVQGKRTGKLGVLSSPYRSKRQQQQKEVQESSGAQRPRRSLHLDLQSQIRSVVDRSAESESAGKSEKDESKESNLSSSDGIKDVEREDLANEEEKRNEEEKEPEKMEEEEEVEKMEEEEVPVEERKWKEGEKRKAMIDSVKEERLREALRELEMIKAEYHRLMEENQRNDLLLAEERTRREFAEAKLRSVKTDLEELEEAIRRKERETKGFLLISRRSLDDICVSFDRLLEMLESVTRNPQGRAPSVRAGLSEDEIARTKIKQRLASVIRKTKSENLRRGFLVDSDDLETSRYSRKSTKKYVRSDSDVRAEVPLHFERNIGDNPDVSTSPGNRTYRRSDREEESPSPAERARQIFKRIVNGELESNFSIT